MSKGFEMQFHWIFVMIAGALILVFFFSLANKYRSISEKDLSASLSWDLDSAFTAVTQVPDTAQTLPSTPDGVSIICNPICSVNIGSYQKPIGDKAVFSPALLTKKIIAWTVPFKMPFKAGNALMLSSPDIHYYIVYDESGESAREYEMLSVSPMWSYLTITGITYNDLHNVQYDGSAQVRFVFLGNKDNIPSDFKEIEVTGVSINNYQAAYFKKSKNSDSWVQGITVPLPYDDSSIHAAMAAQDNKILENGLQNLYRQLWLVSSVYDGRLAQLDNMKKAGKLADSCDYTEAIDLISTMRKNAQELKANVHQTSKLAELKLTADNLVLRNEDLVSQSCPTVF